jgi:hypothetical protein
MKYIILALLSAVTTFASGMPEKFAEAEFRESDYFRYFGLHMQKPDGLFTDSLGRVLIHKSEEGFTVAFYLNDGGIFTRIDEPVILRDTLSPHASALGDIGVPSIAARKKDGTGKIHIYVEKGVLKQKETE